MSEVYIYKKFNAITKEYVPQWDSKNVNDFVSSKRAILINFSNVPEKIDFTLFERPIFKFIVESQFKDAVEKLNQDFFNGLYCDELLFIILNSQATYDSLSWPELNSSQGLDKDLATVQKERQELIEVMIRWVERYQPKDGVRGINSAKSVKSLTIKFEDKTFVFKNFLVIDSLMSTYLQSIGFSYDSRDWVKGIKEIIPYMDLNSLAYQFKVTLTKKLLHWYRDLADIKDPSITNKQLRFINIIFSLASIPINETTIHYKASSSLEDYSSTQQIKVLRNWINRF
ncbi:hypothetical protein [Allomuricauda sp. ARW1Y1]|jgi:hypothetical protein|uniref:hypothetical protein n=1 Tax=Allomuricauda sp. ARW1Y1 TaxID=2663843 RepID=UPI0015C84ACF|nr:hypothetical protein [Muricauda sp. ARW1Y1]NYJ26614.1 hypothetical protein [Muricauda sp. ARW1Y1]